MYEARMIEWDTEKEWRFGYITLTLNIKYKKWINQIKLNKKNKKKNYKLNQIYFGGFNNGWLLERSKTFWVWRHYYHRAGSKLEWYWLKWFERFINFIIAYWREYKMGICLIGVSVVSEVGVGCCRCEF